jgi:hypothetical protein
LNGKCREQRTRAFQLYEEGRRYNNSLTPSYYTMVDTNTEFYAGNQWVHLPQTPAMSRLPKPTFNVIKRVTNVLVSQVTSGGLSVNLEPLSYYDGGAGDPSGGSTTEFAQAEVNNLLEKLKLEYRIRDALFDGAQTGDYCAHFYWDADALPYGGASGAYRGEIKMEMVDGVNVMFGNPNVADAQAQPYILLIGRDTVKSLREEYLTRHPGDDVGASQIQPDAEWREQVASGGKVELSGRENAKCMYIYLYEKIVTEQDMKDVDGNPVLEPVTYKSGEPVYEKNEDGKVLLDAGGRPIQKMKKVREQVTSVHITKCTQSQSIFEDVDTGLTYYPIAWGNWEKQKNCYHGRALVTGVIPNQIFINSMFAMVMRHLQLEAFPKTVYNADLIGQWSNEIGQSIAVRGLQPGQAINQVAANLSPADMSNQIIGVINQVVSFTKECLGVTDVQLGNVKSENTSAIMVMQSNAEVPLENIRAGMYEWSEEIVKILLDMMGTYYGERPIVRSRAMETVATDISSGMPVMNQYTGMLKTTSEERRVMEPYDFSRLKRLFLNVRVDVGSSTAYSEIAMMQTLDNLRTAQMIDVIDYLERVPDKLIPRKQELVDKLKREQSKLDGMPAGTALPDSRTEQQTDSVMQQINANGGSTSQKKGSGKTGSSQTVGGSLDQDKAVSQLPSNVQTQFQKLPTRAKNALAKSVSMKMNN